MRFLIPENLRIPDRLARLHEKCFVVFERFQGANDFLIALPVARGFAGSAIDNEIIRVLGNLRVEVIHQHPHCGFGMPALAGQRIAAQSIGIEILYIKW